MELTPPAALEALLFASGEPLSKTTIEKILGLTAAQLQETAAALRTALTGRGLALMETERELELRSSPEAASVIKKLREGELSRDLGKASLETLAMILYRGTVTRSDIDFVRGVNSSAAIRALLMRGLIERVEDPGDKRRARYQPTVDALAHLGIRTRDELPRYTEFTASLEEAVTRAEESSE